MAKPVLKLWCSGVWQKLLKTFKNIIFNNQNSFRTSESLAEASMWTVGLQEVQLVCDQLRVSGTILETNKSERGAAGPSDGRCDVGQGCSRCSIRDMSRTIDCHSEASEARRHVAVEKLASDCLLCRPAKTECCRVQVVLTSTSEMCRAELRHTPGPLAPWSACSSHPPGGSKLMGVWA